LAYSDLSVAIAQLHTLHYTMERQSMERQSDNEISALKLSAQYK
jgi:hypothetical protein